jgi:hypothetical protein
VFGAPKHFEWASGGKSSYLFVSISNRKHIDPGKISLLEVIRA